MLSWARSDNEGPPGHQARVADWFFVQGQAVEHLSKGPSIPLGPLAANDAIVFFGHHVDPPIVGQEIFVKLNSPGGVVYPPVPSCCLSPAACFVSSRFSCSWPLWGHSPWLDLRRAPKASPALRPGERSPRQQKGLRCVRYGTRWKRESPYIAIAVSRHILPVTWARREWRAFLHCPGDCARGLELAGVE
jgi:hypothetical protein